MRFKRESVYWVCPSKKLAVAIWGDGTVAAEMVAPLECLFRECDGEVRTGISGNVPTSIGHSTLVCRDRWSK